MAKTLEQMTLAELGDELNNVVTKSRAVLTNAEKENRTADTLTDPEREEIHGYASRIAPIKELQKKKQATYDYLSDITNAEELMRQNGDRRTPPQNGGNPQQMQQIMWKTSAAAHLPRQYNRGQVLGCDDYQRAFSSYLRGADPKGILRPGGKNDAQMAASIGMNISDEERGGFFTASEAFSSEIIKNVDDSVYMQGLSRVIMMPPGAQSYGIRVRTNKASSFVFANENTDISGTFDTSLKYGKRVITPNKFQGACVMSKDLLRNYPGAEGMVIGELGINAAEVLEKAYLFADGNQKPLGVMVASNDGIDSGRDLTSGVVAKFGFDDFVQLKYNLKPKYRNTAHFMMHRYMLREISLLKDGEGRYLWEPSRQIGSPDLILGLPFTESEWMPSVFTTGGYYCILGDFQYYYIVWDMAMEMQRLIEMRAYTDEFVYLFRCKLDAAPVLPEAFTRGVFG